MNLPAAPVRRAASSHSALKRAGLTMLVTALLLLAATLGWAGHGWLASDEAPRPFDGFRQVRLKTIQTQLDQVRGPYIVILGDSHAERLFLTSFCGLPVVNAGLSGAVLGDVLDLARKVTPPHKAEAVLLSVGTNDIWVKREPETAKGESGFRAGLEALRQRLSASWSDRRALIAIPPVAGKETAMFPRSAATRYSALLAGSCEPRRCVYADIFAGAESATEPSAAFSDGVHLRDYANFMRDGEPELCRKLGLPAAR
ncbi:SGNH/GDSL hydrolase family protein [Bosea sp. WAO]|uniref:SGNH/GDSL hydrolase family protein n=1 Tax=Bosea sp. WAO TaxID=406341 RepID=UPI0009FAB575|nr:SGNH/GDSL hydrolase family protein [Bosea sp. WAO]